MELENTYNYSKQLMNSASTEDAYKEAARSFESISDYKDSAALAQACYLLAEDARKDAILSAGTVKMAGEVISNYESAITLLESISGWKDSDEKVYACQKKIEEIKAQAEADRLERERKAEIRSKEAERIAKGIKKLAIITTPIVCAVIAFIIILNTVIIPNSKYNNAIELMDAGKYTEAISAFEALEGYKDSTDKISQCNTAILDGKYNDAIALMDSGKYTEAISAFEALEGYKDSTGKINECNTAILDGKYNDALAQIDAGSYIEAYEALIALDGYKDSADKANSIYNKYRIEKMKLAKVGDYVFFGTYEQDNNTSNGKEEVEWLVLEVKDGKILVISKYALDCKRYNTRFTYVTWETCSLRQWLNNDFINSAFTADEKAMIPIVTVSADENPEYSTNPGKATQDQVFLLSIAEVNRYFSSDSARMCNVTDYAVANGAYVNDENKGWWWLRSPGQRRDHATYVHQVDGYAGATGIVVFNDGIVVRPALWIDLNY